MYKCAFLFALVACAFAAPAPGFLAAPAAYHAAPIVAAAPAVAIAHSLPIATSYANTYKVDHKSTFISPAVAYAAPIAPVAIGHAAPAYYSAHPASLTYAAHGAPVAYVH
ncbi:hypothetical protein PV325_002027 [Microctonus aethiopoides]|uniref:Uncharacterized protein n=1 Tax=Microctonus aethiopoides TaxID=144406 RepID=A0AA39FI14_9HYME|nr:hypothetical protein PV325_002027 [Microctonus aethiopoides]KAK0092782.1 hypothetical protein PV326_000616 [Microctonus aethiopoides]KAK0169714.1 hypothetical protein PV328_010358 [Microctonus aethiopoides]